MGRHRILGLLCFVFLLYSSLPLASPLCPPDQRDALLYFKNSFVLNKTWSNACHRCRTFHLGKGSSWNKNVDCCSWDRVTCDNVSGNVIGLNLTSIWFRGTLYSNSSLLLPKLQLLNMSSCNLTKFPYFLNSLKGLTHLDLSSNEISGEIPRWFWGISHHTLENLDLSDNKLEGGIQQLHWKRLSYMNLYKNSFQGPLPIPSPSTCYFYANNNGFTGGIPSSICQLSSLLKLDLSKNNLSGNIPPCFGNITNLEHLDLSNNKLQGPILHSLVKCTNLSILVLSYNKFNDIFSHWLETSLPTNVFSNTSLELIDLSNNNFGGLIPLLSPVTKYYSIARNNITGKIPSLICNVTNLLMIDLSNNSLTGGLPQCITNFSNVLAILNLGMNQLEGTIPRSISLRLTTLDLSENWFEGTLPRSLVNCSFLEFLNLGRNQIDDTFPSWLGKLPELKVLILRSNNFKGLLNIPRADLIFPKLRILDLSTNNFYGPLPTNLIINLKNMINTKDGQDESLYMTWSSIIAGFTMLSITKSYRASYDNTVSLTYKGRERELAKILTIFTVIDLSSNSFQGDIPDVIGHLQSLIGLNLSHNQFIGSIPPTLGNLTNLEWLDLSSNKLRGGIPRVLGDLTFLGYLNLSKNQLTGRIPQDKQLSTFFSDSFDGNPGLCGTPLPRACLGDAQFPPPLSSSTLDHEGHESWFKQKVVWIGYASGIVIGVSIAYITIETRRPKWLARGVTMLERRAAHWMEKPRQKAIKFRGQ